jgi:hypothetical protein
MRLASWTALSVTLLRAAASCEEDPVSRIEYEDDTGGSSASGSSSGGSGGRNVGGTLAQGGSSTDTGGTQSSAGTQSSEGGNSGGEPAVEPSGGSAPEAGTTGDAGETSTGGRAAGGQSNSGGSKSTGGSKATGGMSTGAAGASGRVPAFVAQGYRQRTLVSCDDGQSWVADAGLSEVNCQEEDCDHDEGAPRGIAYGNGWFVATFGWGTPGSVRRSADGVTWEETRAGSIHTEVAFGNGMFMLGGGGEQPYISADGTDWMKTSETPNPHSRVVEYVPFDMRFVVFGEVDASITTTADFGETWDVPSDRPAECGPGATGIASGNGVIVGATGRDICFSNDDGDTWQLVTMPQRLTTVPIWDGERFMIWSGGVVNISTDGETWTQETCTPSGISPTAVGIGDQGTLVSSQGTNEGLRFYRSEDGVSWERLADDRFPKGTGIKYIEFGEVLPSDACPAD